jgi:hypothetical protein
VCDQRQWQTRRDTREYLLPYAVHVPNREWDAKEIRGTTNDMNSVLRCFHKWLHSPLLVAGGKVTKHVFGHIEAWYWVVVHCRQLQPRSWVQSEWKSAHVDRFCLAIVHVVSVDSHEIPLFLPSMYYSLLYGHNRTTSWVVTSSITALVASSSASYIDQLERWLTHPTWHDGSMYWACGCLRYPTQTLKAMPP